MNTLDPDPDNELGQGVLDPAFEQYLLTAGYIFARRIFNDGGTFFIVICQYPNAQYKSTRPALRRRTNRPMLG